MSLKLPVVDGRAKYIGDLILTEPILPNTASLTIEWTNKVWHTRNTWTAYKHAASVRIYHYPNGEPFTKIKWKLRSQLVRAGILRTS